MTLQQILLTGEERRFLSASRFHHTKLLLIILSRKTDVVDAWLFGRLAVRCARSQRQDGYINRSIAQINGVVLTLLNQFHAHGVDEKLGHSIHVYCAICDMSNLCHASLL